MTVCILCMNYSSTSPSQSGDGQIKLSHYLKDFNFITTLLQSGNIFMSHLWVPQGSEVGNIYPCIIKVQSEMQKDFVGVSWSEKVTGVRCAQSRDDLLGSGNVEFAPDAWEGCKQCQRKVQSNIHFHLWASPVFQTLSSTCLFLCLFVTPLRSLCVGSRKPVSRYTPKPRRAVTQTKTAHSFFFSFFFFFFFFSYMPIQYCVVIISCS